MSNRTIEQNLTLLSSTKRDIRNAINIKGGSVSSATPFADYATAISNLPSGGGGTDLDWSLIGYSARPSTITVMSSVYQEGVCIRQGRPAHPRCMLMVSMI